MKVFISCSSHDKEIADIYKGKLVALGVRVSTGASFNPGESFHDALRQELITADLIVVLLTNHYLSSSWMQAEMGAILFTRETSDFYVIAEKGIKPPDYLNGFAYIGVDSIESPGDAVFERIADKKELFSGSAEKAKSTLFKSLFGSNTAAIITTVMTLFATIITVVLEKTTLSTTFGDKTTTFIVIALITVATMMGVTTYTYALRRRKTVEERAESEQYSKKLKEAISPTEPPIYVDGKNIIVHYSCLT